MGGPAWLTDIFAAVMITVAAYCASRLVVARWWRRPTDVDTDGVHVVMGVAMAGMLVAGLRFGSFGLWEAVFAAAAGWFGWRFVRARHGAPLSPWRCPQPVPHLVECGAMLYMYLAVPAVAAAAKGASGASGAMGGMSATGARFSVLALALALFMFGYVAWVGDRLTARAPAPPAAVPSAAVPSAAVPSAAVPAAAVPVAAVPQESGALMTATGPEPVATGPEPAGDASPGGCAGSGQGRPYLAPRCAAMCKIAMGITMGYVLILML
jgi:Domain of unknown function (DUF5134)